MLVISSSSHDRHTAEFFRFVFATMQKHVTEIPVNDMANAAWAALVWNATGPKMTQPWQQLKLTPGTLFSSADRRQKAMIMSGQRYHFPIHDAIQFQGQSAFKESKMAFAGKFAGFE